MALGDYNKTSIYHIFYLAEGDYTIKEWWVPAQRYRSMVFGDWGFWA